MSEALATHEIHTALHHASLDVLTGYGVVVLPLDADDVANPFRAEALREHGITGMGGSLREHDWNAMMRELHRVGWEPMLDTDDTLIHEATTTEGRPVIALYCLDPIHDISGDIAHQARVRQDVLIPLGVPFDV